MSKYSDLTIKEKVELLLQLRNEDPELDQFVKKLDNLFQKSDKLHKTYYSLYPNEEEANSLYFQCMDAHREYNLALDEFIFKFGDIASLWLPEEYRNLAMK